MVKHKRGSTGTTAESSRLVAMINRGRATHYSTLTVKFTGRYRAAERLGQPHREPSTHLPQINRLSRIVRRAKRNVNCSKESPTVRARVPTVAEVAHHDCSRRRAEERPVDATAHVRRIDSSCLRGIGRVLEKIRHGGSEARHGESRPSDAAHSPRGTNVSREVSRLRCSASERKPANGNHDLAPISAHVAPAGWQAGRLRVDAGSVCCLSGSRALSHVRDRTGPANRFDRAFRTFHAFYLPCHRTDPRPAAAGSLACGAAAGGVVADAADIAVP